MQRSRGRSRNEGFPRMDARRSTDERKGYEGCDETTTGWTRERRTEQKQGTDEEKRSCPTWTKGSWVRFG